MTGWWWFARAHRVPEIVVGVVAICVAIVGAGAWAVEHRPWGSHALLPVAVLGAVVVSAVVVAGMDGAVPEVVGASPLRRAPALLASTAVVIALAALMLVPLRAHTGLLVSYDGAVRNLIGLVGLALLAAAIAGEAWGWTLPLLVGLGTPFVEGVARSGSLAAFLVRPDGDGAAWTVAAALAVTGAIALLLARPRAAEEVDA